MKFSAFAFLATQFAVGESNHSLLDSTTPGLKGMARKHNTRNEVSHHILGQIDKEETEQDARKLEGCYIPTVYPDNVLASGATINPGNADAIWSENQKVFLKLFPNGNLIVREILPSGTRNDLWNSETANDGVVKGVMQANGNLVLKDSSNSPKWTTSGHGAKPIVNGSFLHMQNDGNLVLRHPMDCSALWSTRTKLSDAIEYRTDKSADHNIATYVLEDYFGSNDPAIFAQMQSFNGNDPSQIRLTDVSKTSFSAFVEEETSKDDEVNHANAEDLGYLAIHEGPINDVDGNLIGEVLSIDVNQPTRNDWHVTSFLEGTYDDPVVIGMMNSYNGDHPTVIRIDNVGSNYIAFRMEEWDYLDGGHTTETIKFLILEAGHHRISSNGESIGFVAKKVHIDHTWGGVCELDAAFDFDAIPGVLSQTMSTAGLTPVVTRHKNVALDSVNIKLQEEEENDGIHATELVGVVAFGAATVGEQCVNYDPVAVAISTVDTWVNNQLLTLQNNYMADISIFDANNAITIGSQSITPQVPMNIAQGLFDSLNGSGVSVLPPQIICGGSDSTNDIVAQATAYGVSSCEHLDFTSEVDVYAFGFEESDGKGLCGAVDWNTKTFGLAFSDILKVEVKKFSMEIELNAIGLSLSGKLSRESLNDIYEWQGSPAKRRFWGHFLLKATVSVSKDLGEEYCESVGISENSCQWKDYLAVGVDSTANLLVDADPDNNDVCTGSNPFGNDFDEGALYFSLQTVPTLSILGEEIDLSHLFSADVDFYLYGGIAGSETIFSAQLNTPSLSDFEPSGGDLGALQKLFDGGSVPSAFTASIEAYGIMSPSRKFVGFRVRNMQSQLGIGSILNGLQIAGVDINLGNEIEQMLGLGQTTGFEIEYTADFDVTPNDIKACLTIDGEAPICTKFCSANSDCPSDSYCLLQSTINLPTSICLPKMEVSYPCLNDDMCKSGDCSGIDLGALTAGVCSDCNTIDSISECGGPESGKFCFGGLYCVNQFASGVGASCLSNNACQDYCTGLTIDGTGLGFCNECPTWNRNTGCNSNQHCDATYSCVPDKPDGDVCTHNHECQNYCTALVCTECPTLNRNTGCNNNQHCDATWSCIPDKPYGDACLHDDECQSGICHDFFCRECTQTNRNSNCNNNKHCSADFRCIPDKSSGLCIHSDECTGSCCTGSCCSGSCSYTFGIAHC